MMRAKEAKEEAGSEEKLIKGGLAWGGNGEVEWRPELYAMRGRPRLRRL
jgi:hypothetical protein